MARMVGQEQPEVVHRGAHHHVVEIDDHEAFARTFQEVAPVAVTMDADQFGAFKEAGDALDDARCQVRKALLCSGVTKPPLMM